MRSSLSLLKVYFCITRLLKWVSIQTLQRIKKCTQRERLCVCLHREREARRRTAKNRRISGGAEPRTGCLFCSAAALCSTCRSTSNAERALWSVCLARLARLSYRLTRARGSALTDRRPTRGAGWRRRSGTPPRGSTPRLTVICSTRPLHPAL